MQKWLVQTGDSLFMSFLELQGILTPNLQMR